MPPRWKCNREPRKIHERNPRIPRGPRSKNLSSKGNVVPPRTIRTGPIFWLSAWRLAVVNWRRQQMSDQDSNATMAVFLDLENIALGARDAHYPSFDIQKVLERLLLKGHIVVKKAYCDFDRYKAFKRDLHEAAFELIEIPHLRQSGKHSADIRMAVDALDLCYTKSHVDTFVIISGDSDFSPLVSKLRENA